MGQIKSELDAAVSRLNEVCDALEDRANVLPEGPEHEAERNRLVSQAYAAAMEARHHLNAVAAHTRFR